MRARRSIFLFLLFPFFISDVHATHPTLPVNPDGTIRLRTELGTNWTINQRLNPPPQPSRAGLAMARNLAELRAWDNYCLQVIHYARYTNETAGKRLKEADTAAKAGDWAKVSEKLGHAFKALQATQKCHSEIQQQHSGSLRIPDRVQLADQALAEANRLLPRAERLNRRLKQQNENQARIVQEARERDQRARREEQQRLRDAEIAQQRQRQQEQQQLRDAELVRQQQLQRQLHHEHIAQFRNQIAQTQFEAQEDLQVTREALNEWGTWWRLGRQSRVLKDGLNQGESLINAAYAASQESEPKTNLVEMMSRYGSAQIKAIREYVVGVRDGVREVGAGINRAADLLAQNPELLRRIPAYIMNTITDPTDFLQHASDAFIHANTKLGIASGLIGDQAPYERGKALGELASELLTAATVGEIAAPLAEGLGVMAGAMLDSEMGQTIGQTLFDGVRANPELASEIAIVDAASVRVISSLEDIGLPRGESIDFLNSNAGKVWSKTRSTGIAPSDEGYKLFNKEVAVNNPLPSDGWYARVMPRQFAEQLLNGSGDLVGSTRDLITGKAYKEAFITAYEDVSSLRNQPTELARKLAVYTDKKTTTLRDLSEGQVVVKFRMNNAEATGISSPIEQPGGRGWGWIPGGRTEGGAREWLLFSEREGDSLLNFVDRASITLEEVL